MVEVGSILTQKPIIDLIKIHLYRNPKFVINLKKVCKLFNERYDLGGCIFIIKQSYKILNSKKLEWLLKCGAYSLDFERVPSKIYELKGPIFEIIDKIYKLKGSKVHTLDLSNRTIDDLSPFLSVNTLILRSCFLFDNLGCFSNEECNARNLDLSFCINDVDINPILKGNVEWLKIDGCVVKEEILPSVCRQSKLKRISVCFTKISQTSLDALKLIKNLKIED